MKKYVLQFWLIIFALSHTKSLKMWTPSTSLDDPSNWGGDRPTTCDRLFMSLAQDITIQMPTTAKLSIKSFIFPRQGVFTFPKKASLSLAGIGECSQLGKDIRFLPQLIRGWLDPQNWNGTPSSGWVPHNARVPCAGETVVFPFGKSLTVMLPSILVPSGPILYQKKAMDTNKWSEFLQSEEGYESFKGSADLRELDWYSDSGCINDKLCQCTRNTYAIKDWSYNAVDSYVYNEAVCVYVKPRCETLERPQCYAPVYPEGHCCGVCGSILNLHDPTENGISLNSIKAVISSVLKSYESKLEFYVGRRSNGGIQVVVLSSDGDPSESFTIVRAAIKRFEEQNIGIIETLTYSGVSRQSDRKSVVLSTIFGTLIAILSFFGSLYYVFMVLPKQKWSMLSKRDPFTFARFRNNLPEAVSTETLVLETDRPTIDSFANPLYSPDGAVALETLPSSSSLKPEESEKIENDEPKPDELVVLDDTEKTEEILALDKPTEVDEAAALNGPKTVVPFLDEAQNLYDIRDSDEEGSVDSFSEISGRMKATK